MVNTEISSVHFSHLVVSDSLWPHGPQHTRPPCPSPTHRVYPNSCLLSWWCHPTILYTVIPFSSHLWSFPASGSFQVSQLFTSGGQSTGVSASTSVFSMNIQDWFPWEWTGWISLQSKGLSRVFSNTNTEIRLIILFAANDGEALYSQHNQDRELTVAHIMNSLLPNSDSNWRK